jgi:hypothetical protein
MPGDAKVAESASRLITASSEQGSSPRAHMAALSAERAVPIRCAFGLADSGLEFDDIDCFLSWLKSAGD